MRPFVYETATSPGMAVNMVNVGAKYPVTFVDANGDFLLGANSYKLNLPKGIPAALFWSVTVYSSEGYFEPNEYGAYSLNSSNAIKGPDGSVAIQFGGCDGKISNCLPITTGWNYTVRLFRPRTEVLDGTWKFPRERRKN